MVWVSTWRKTNRHGNETIYNEASKKHPVRVLIDKVESISQENKEGRDMGHSIQLLFSIEVPPHLVDNIYSTLNE